MLDFFPFIYEVGGRRPRLPLYCGRWTSSFTAVLWAVDILVYRLIQYNGRGGNRTHRGQHNCPPHGFEGRDRHQTTSASTFNIEKTNQNGKCVFNRVLCTVGGRRPRLPHSCVKTAGRCYRRGVTATWCYRNVVLPQRGVTATWCYRNVVLPQRGVTATW